MKHVVMYSGGAGSWAAAQRVAGEHGTDDLILLFCDTMMEDEDLYRFLRESAVNIGGELIELRDGRNVWQVFHDTKFIGNPRVSNCSLALKQKPARAWLDANCDPAETTVYVGIDWSEEHRLGQIVEKYKPFRVEAPLCDAPLIDKADVIKWLEYEGVAPPRLYAMGFAHNNCGGFCVRSGQKQFRRLLETMPERYAWHEQHEDAMREYLGKDVSIMKDRRGGETKPLTMRAFRERLGVDRGDCEDEWGGCVCF